MKKAIETREDIELFVNTFYDKAREHKDLGPIFNDNIGQLWFLHLDTMYRFWETLLLNKKTYHGSPFPKHKTLPIKNFHFDQWMELFNETLDELFEGPTVDDAKKKGITILSSFRNRMGYSNPIPKTFINRIKAFFLSYQLSISKKRGMSE